MRQLEAVVPQGDLRGLELLGLLPGVDAVLGAGSPADRLEDQAARAGNGDVAARGVRDDHRVGAGAVLEEVVDALFFHQAAREREVRLAVLDAVVAGGKGSLDLPGDVETHENLLEDVGDRDLLEDAALRLAGEQERLRDEVEHEARERGVPRALGDPQAGAVEVARAASRQGDLDGDLLAQEGVEDDLLGLVVLGDALELKEEGLGDRLVSRKAVQKQDVGTQGRRDLESAAVLRVGHSAPLVLIWTSRKNTPRGSRDLRPPRVAIPSRARLGSFSRKSRWQGRAAGST